tara:strand:+ start:2372 stop:2620 length:249 start_codon:yes stop_codon:yes gene_type:complete
MAEEVLEQVAPARGMNWDLDEAGFLDTEPNLNIFNRIQHHDGYMITNLQAEGRKSCGVAVSSVVKFCSGPGLTAHVENRLLP